MNKITALNGYYLYNSFISGYDHIAKEKNYLNDINVFPVADGDTGNNMVSTFYASVRIKKVSGSLSATLGQIADRTLAGARGNSGIIIAQFINSFAAACGSREKITTPEFGSALLKAFDSTWSSIENPKEGTILTLMREWSSEIHGLSDRIHDFSELFLKSLSRAHDVLLQTTAQLDVLKKANVVDAGASGFMSFLNGIARMLQTGVVPEIQTDDIIFSEVSDENHGSGSFSADIPYRYCTEALISRKNNDSDQLKKDLSGLGDSLIVSKGRSMTKIHIHTNEPSELFFRIRDYGTIVEQKADDMILQFNAVHNPVSDVAIVTDSIADIPNQIIDRYQIHVIPQTIIWGEDEYLDRITITGKTLYPYLDERSDYPGSSAPDPARVRQMFSWLASHYKSIIAIPVSRNMSATWQVMNTEAEKLRAKGYPAAVIDSRLNSAAQGLLVVSAARDAAEGFAHSDIIERTQKKIKRISIYVSVSTFKYMVRGGRITRLKGLIGTAANLKPIVSIDEQGRGIAFGASFSQNGSRKKIMKKLRNEKDNIEQYAVVHAAALDRAAVFVENLRAITGMEPEYVMEISPIVGIHAGIGAVAVACVYKESIYSGSG